MLRLRVLGGLALEKDGVPLDGAAAQRRPLALLALLAAAGDTSVSRDRLCSFLWPDSDVERARGSLKQSLYTVRRDLGAADIVIGSTDLRLNPEIISSDVREFRRALASGDLEAAVSTYAGPLLDGVHLRDADDFERWSEEVRRELAAQYAKALDQLTTQAGERGDWASAVRWARMWSAAEPLSERAIMRFMTALDAIGDRAGAVKKGELHRSILRAELDVEPGAALMQLLAQLRDPDFPAVSVEEIAPTTAPLVSPTSIDRARDDLAKHGDAVAAFASGATIAQHPMPTSAPPRPLRRGSHLVLAAVAVALTGAAWMGSRTIHAATRRQVFALMPVGLASSDSAFTSLQRDLEAAVATQIVAMGRVTMLQHADTSTARYAGADHLIDAVIQTTSERVSVGASIRSARDGHVEVALDAISVPRSMSHTLVPIVTDRIGGAVAALTDTLYAAWSLAGSRTPTYAAYQAFSLALESIAHHDPSYPVDPIVEQLANVSRLDASFAAARVLLIEQSDLNPGLRALSDSVQVAALEQRHALGVYDTAALDNIVAIRAGDWEAALTAARRMVSIAPTLADAHFAVARAQMATRRYQGALASLDTLAHQHAWFSSRPELWQWDLTALHLLGQYETGVAHFARLAAQRPDDHYLCLWGLPDLVALNREAAVDAQVAHCASLVGGSTNGPAKIPNRSYFSIVIPHYIAHGNREAAIRAAARIRPAFQKYAAKEPAKARDLATIDCMLGDWATCYPPLAMSTMSAGELYEYGIRRLGVAAARMGDTLAVRAALFAIDSAAAWQHRGHAELARAMIYLAAGRRDTAVGWLGRARNAGAAPSATEWVAWPATLGHDDWYHAWELLPLRGDPIFEGIVRPRKD